jgi:transcription initiation factor TFIID TATA-box-binding protein
LAVHLGLENIEYEPEQFPGLIYRPSEIDTVNLIFSSGKTIISGTVQDEVAERSAEYLRKQLSTLPL